MSGYASASLGERWHLHAGASARIARALLLLLGACREPSKLGKPREVRPAAPATAATSVAPSVAFEARALSLAWTGFATLPLDVEKLAHDHTLFARFMPAYEGGYRGVVVADRSGRYRLGMAPYASLSQPAVEVLVGSTTFTAPLPAPVLSGSEVARTAEPPLRPRWLSLAVSVREGLAKVYLDGALLGELAAEARGFEGPWRLGRLAHAEGPQDQFYGLIDDVALFDRALSAPEVLALSRARRIDSRLDALAAFADFDRKRSGLNALEPTPQGAAALVAVSGTREASIDAVRLPPPTVPVRLHLPFGPGEVWIVIQGANSVGSHHDSAAFALDFQRVDPRIVEHNPRREPGASAALSEGQPVFAAADGRVVSLVDCFRDATHGCGAALADSPEGEARKRNLVCLEHAERFVSCYLHLKTARVALGEKLRRGAPLGRVGDSGTRSSHLHFAVSDLGESSVPGAFTDLVTLPFAFSDYDASDDFGRSWQRVDFGMPRRGQWVRAPVAAERAP